MLVYLKIAHEALPIRAVFILGCGWGLKDLVQPCWFIRGRALPLNSCHKKQEVQSG